MRLIMIQILVLIALGCTSQDKRGTITKPHAEFGFWFDGSVDEAFALAKSQQKPVFLYWGAVWCPPCNELKKEVFTQVKFHSLMKRVVPVYLDGDLEDAQTWADKFDVSGYPTVLLLDGDRQEMMRLSTSIDSYAFMQNFERAVNDNLNIGALIDKALNSRATDGNWQTIAGYNWYWGWKKDPFITLKKLYVKVPSHLKQVKARLAGGLLVAFNKLKDAEKSKKIKEMKKVLRFATTGDENIYQNRSIIFYYSGSLSKSIFAKNKTQRRRFKRRMLAAADKLAQGERLTLNEKLMSVYTHLEFAKRDSKKKPVFSKSQKRDLAARIRAIDSKAESKYERKASISTAGWMLNEIGETDAAIKMLVKEASQSDTPYYYQSILASIYEEQNKIDSALKWSSQARGSASGRATVIQWQVNDLLLNIRSMPKFVSSEDVAKLLSGYYENTFSLVDGFRGRNAARARRVAGAFEKIEIDDSVRVVFQRYAKKCQSLSSKKNCSEHFAKLLKK